MDNLQKNTETSGEQFGEETDAALFEQYSKSVVRIGKYIGSHEMMSGSGFFVEGGERCQIATTRHVAHGENAWVTTREGKTYKAKAVLLDDKHEISIYALDPSEVKDPETTCKALEVSRTAAAKGEPVLSLGAAGDWSDDKDFSNRLPYHKLSALHPGYLRGVIEGEIERRKFWDWATWVGSFCYQFGDPKDRMVKGSDMVSTGYSGGPWINRSGQVVGITYGAIRHWFRPNDGLAESAGFLARDLDLLKEERERMGGKLDVPLRLSR